MSADQISRLHEQASEHYLNGDYPAALASWRELLALDPGNEAALEGARMAEQFAEDQHPAAPVADIEQDLDQGLKVFDSLGMKAPAPPAPPAFELGDPSQVDSAPVMMPIEEGWDTSPGPEEVSFGLAPALVAATDAGPGVPTAAAIELRRRVDDLLTQARAKIDAGERDDALSILARVSILDEENAEAAAIRTQLESSGKTDLDRIEQAIIEGVAALESERLDESERLFQEVLSLSPGHREAVHYLEQLEAKRAAAEAPGEPSQEDLLGSGPFGDIAEPNSPAAEIAPIAVAPKPRPSRPLPPSMPDAQRPGRRGIRLPSMKLVLGLGVAAAAVAGGFIVVPQILSGGSEPATPVPAAAAPPETIPATKPVPTAQPATSPATSPAIGAAERAAGVARAVARGQRLSESGDHAGAIVAFNEAIALEPANLDARAGLASAGAHYKAGKADQDAIKAIEGAFADGEYTAGLRLAYRLPGSVDPSRVEQIKAAGWYNLAIVALRAGDCRGAMGNLDEVLGISSGDAEAVRLKDFATRYADVPKDRAFLDTVEALPFRKLP